MAHFVKIVVEKSYTTHFDRDKKVRHWFGLYLAFRCCSAMLRSITQCSVVGHRSEVNKISAKSSEEKVKSCYQIILNPKLQKVHPSHDSEES